MPSTPQASRFALAAFFVAAGVLHFVKPAAYKAIVPPGLPSPRGLVYGSGVAEVAGGLAVLSGRLRPWAGWWLIALLVAVFPANVYMAVAPEDIEGLEVPRVALWLRLPLQGVMIWWVWRACLSPVAPLRQGSS
jgi:uncharacterized membrane protein